MRRIKILLLLLISLSCKADYNPFIRADQDHVEFVVLITSYNNENNYYRNLDSVVHQRLDAPFEVMYVDDASTDVTGKGVDEFVRDNNLESLVTVIHNKKRVGTLENLYNVIHMCPDHKVIVLVDGNDFLAHDKVLAHIEEEYKKENVWLAYSQMIYYPKEVSGELSAQFPSWVFKTQSFRYYTWITYQVKTFYAGLFKKIKKEDLLWKDEQFFPMMWDYAIMFPLLEMASGGHVVFMPEVLYVYNHNPHSDRHAHTTLQLELGDLIRMKPHYEPIEDSHIFCLR
jgi:glycosyltransferase involved in cell wall biosynthesis